MYKHKCLHQHYSYQPKNGDIPNIHQLMDGWTKKFWHLQTTDYYLATEWNEMLTQVLSWKNLEDIMLSERRQTPKTTCCMIPCRWNVQNKQIHRDKKQISSCQGLGEGDGESLPNGHRVSLWGDENVLELDYGDSHTTPWIDYKILNCEDFHFFLTNYSLWFAPLFSPYLS